jgi:hypothetical protein
MPNGMTREEWLIEAASVLADMDQAKAHLKFLIAHAEPCEERDLLEAILEKEQEVERELLAIRHEVERA